MLSTTPAPQLCAQQKTKKYNTMATWKLDPTHSELSFKVRHLMITNVTGHVGKFDVTAESTDDNFSGGSVQFTADMNTITTGDANRDGHLKTADFFEAEQYPTMKFESTSFNGSKLEGHLTIKNITKPVTLDVDFGGIGTDPWGNVKAGFSLSGKINRKDWELNWNAPLEAGGVLVSEEVRLHAEIQLVKS
jgi:polyisoprenoid-binding protein YceI